MTTAFIVDYLRSPFTPAHRGALAGVRPDDLAASVIAALVRRSGLTRPCWKTSTWAAPFPKGNRA